MIANEKFAGVKSPLLVRSDTPTYWRSRFNPTRRLIATCYLNLQLVNGIPVKDYLRSVLVQERVPRN